jgi:hypothetical protein
MRLELSAGLGGRRRRIRRGGYPSRKAALEVLAPGPEGRRDGRNHGERDWLGSQTSPAASTVRGYAAHIRLYLGPYLGDVLLTQLTVGQVQAMFTAIIHQHQALGTPVSAATLTRIRATLRGAECGHPAGPDPRQPGRQCGAAAGAASPRGGVDAVPGRAVAPSGGAAPVAVRTARQTAQFLDSIR